MVVYIILAVVFVVLLVAYMRVRGRRLSRENAGQTTKLGEPKRPHGRARPPLGNS